MDTKCRLSPMALGLALGVSWGLFVLILGILATFFAVGTPFVTTVGHVYVGYEASLIGSLIGALVAFVNSFIGGVIVALFYNFFAGCCSSQCK